MANKDEISALLWQDNQYQLQDDVEALDFDR